MRLTRWGWISIAWMFHGCSTTTVEPQPMLPEGPSYLSVPHPQGFDLSEVELIFRDEQAPKADQLKDCDKDYKEVKRVVTAPEDVERGIRELVEADPVRYHWCFYKQISEMMQRIEARESAIRDRQKAVLDTFEFLAPVAKAFRISFSDTRYQRYAVVRYRELSPWVFYRNVDMTPQATSDLLAGVAQPFGALRAPAQQNGASVLERYGIRPSAAGSAGEGPMIPASDLISEPSSSGNAASGSP